jgi:hypothetical protein
MNFTVPSPFGSPIGSIPSPPSAPPPYPMSCVPFGFDEKIAVAVVAGTTWGFLMAALGILLYKRVAERPTMVKYNRKILTNMDTIPENQSMEDV